VGEGDSVPRSTWLILLLAITLPAATQAQPAPASAATTAPSAPSTQSAVPSDQSTPRGALKVWTIAMNQGDADTIRAVLDPTTPIEKRMVEALIAQRQAIHRLKVSSDNAFGHDGTVKIVGDMDATQAQSIASIGDLSEQIDGDQALVIDGNDQLKFKKLNGKWVFPIATMPNVDFDSADEAVGRLAALSKMLDEVSASIESGKYKTAKDAADDLQAKSFALATRAAATQPSSAPTSQPVQ
jgi:hypothetical protein